jgi:hypothetical protein
MIDGNSSTAGAIAVMAPEAGPGTPLSSKEEQ